MESTESRVRWYADVLKGQIDLVREVVGQLVPRDTRSPMSTGYLTAPSRASTPSWRKFNVLLSGALKSLSQELIAEDRQQDLNEMLDWDGDGWRFLEERQIEICAQAMALYTEGRQLAGPTEDAHEAGLNRAAVYALRAGFCRETLERWVKETWGKTHAHRPRS